MDDFTFPTAAAAAEPADSLCLHHTHPHRLPFPLFAASPLLFPSSPTANAAAAVAVAPVVVSRSVDDMKEQEPTSGATERRAEGGGEGELVSGAGAGAADEDKMDMLWENFNEELEALRRAGSCSKAPAGGGAAAGGVELTSDTESETAGRGFAPMLRPSSRAGGTGQYRRTSWVLLMRIFRRLFVIEKTISAARQQARAQ